MFNKIMLVGIGGFTGASLRYLISLISLKFLGDNFPFGTLIVNVVGCFLIGLIISLEIPNEIIASNMRLLVITGILGGLTTFSTFSLESINLFSAGRYWSFFLNVSLSLLLCLIGVSLGKAFYKVFV